MTEHLYYRDCQLLEFSGHVVDQASVAGAPAVVLDRTAFYPTSGGQPHDLGDLGGVPVIDVIDDENTILHVLAGEPPAIGTEVVGRIAGPRRRDHTQQHTGQHVLSQAFERVGGLRTVSFHLGTETCTIDLDQPNPDLGAVRGAENLANEIVLEDRAVLLHFAQADDLERFGLRKPSERTGEIRIVEVEDFDRSACGGTHVQRTGQIGPIKIRRWERRGDVARIEFICGWRAIEDYQSRLQTTRAIAERLSANDSDLLGATTRALDDLDRLRAETSQLHLQLLDYEAKDLASRATPLAMPPGVSLIIRGFDDRPVDELKRLALALVKDQPVVAILGAGGARRSLILAQHPGLPFDLNGLLRQIAPLIDAKGGGGRDLAQGGSATGGSVEPALVAARAILTGETPRP